MSESEEKKFACVCGSEVKEANRKAHEKTKKHQNYQHLQSNGYNNAMPVQNLAIPKSKAKKQPPPSLQPSQLDEEYDEFDDGEDEDDDEFEQALIESLNSIQQKVEMVLGEQNTLKNSLQKLDNVLQVARVISDRLTNVEDLLRALKPKEDVWINDKCTPRN